MGAPDEWPSRRDLANTRQAGVGLPSKQNPAYRPAGNFTAARNLRRSARQRRVAYGAGGVVGAVGEAAGGGGGAAGGVWVAYQMMPSTASTATAMRIVL